jgi:short-subunit dehydrogenase
MRAVITGASSGLGVEMARELARRGCDLVLTARRADRLDALAAELRAAGADVVTVPLDLCEPGAPARLVEAAHDGGRDVDILINNAGFGVYDRFGPIPWERHAAILDLNIRVVTELTWRFIERMRARPQRSYVSNVASMTSYLHTKRFAVYGATKAYVRNFSSTLADELKDTGVSVSTLCFGGTDTPFNEVAGIGIGRLYRIFVMKPDRAARIAVRGLLAGRRLVVPGVMNKLIRVSAWLFPARLMAWTVGHVMGPTRPALPPGDPR